MDDGSFSETTIVWFVVGATVLQMLTKAAVALIDGASGHAFIWLGGIVSLLAIAIVVEQVRRQPKEAA